MTHTSKYLVITTSPRHLAKPVHNYIDITKNEHILTVHLPLEDKQIDLQNPNLNIIRQGKYEYIKFGKHVIQLPIDDSLPIETQFFSQYLIYRYDPHGNNCYKPNPNSKFHSFTPVSLE